MNTFTRASRRVRRCALVGTLAASLTAGAFSALGPGDPRVEAYVPNPQYWPNNSAPYSLTDPSWPSAWYNAANGAASAWTGAGANFQYVASPGNPSGVMSTSNSGNTGVLAQSTWWYDGANHITRAQVVVNTYYQFNPRDPAAPGSQGVYDIQSVLTHEMGHWLSLGHSTSRNSDGSTPVMYASFAPGEVRTVGSDDKAGIIAIYGASSAATATPTAAAATATPTRAPATATPTRTPVRATATPTRPAAPTNTPVPIPTFPVFIFPTPPPFPWFPGFNAPARTGRSSQALVEANVEQLTADPATLRIVVGRVNAVKPSRFAPDGQTITTDTVVDVNEHLLSQGTERQVTVRNQGGQVGSTRMVAEDFPSLQPGQLVLLFLSRAGTLMDTSDGAFYLRGLDQGLFYLRSGRAVGAFPGRDDTEASLRARIAAARGGR